MPASARRRRSVTRPMPKSVRRGLRPARRAVRAIRMLAGLEVLVQHADRVGGGEGLGDLGDQLEPARRAARRDAALARSAQSSRLPPSVYSDSRK